MKSNIYDHYIAIDWSIKNMAIARMTKKSNKITTIDVPSDIVELQVYLKNLRGTKVLAVEETTTSQWLYTELKDYVDEIIICDPHRNKLLSDGPKNDKIDAAKLVQLLKAGLMKEVYHYVLECLDRQIVVYAEEKKGYEEEFLKLARKYPEIRHQMSLPGIGIINAVKIISRVVTPYRFADNGHYLSYSGLIKLEKISGGRSCGRKDSRYCRQLKYVYKIGVATAIGGNNPINDYYEYLIREKGYPENNARNKACRRLAVLSLGVFKSGKRYQPSYRRKRIRKS